MKKESLKCFCCGLGIINGDFHEVDGEKLCPKCHGKIAGGKIFVFCDTCGKSRAFTENHKNMINRLLKINSTTDGVFNELKFNMGLALAKNTGMVLFPIEACPLCVGKSSNQTDKKRTSHIALNERGII